MSREHVRLSVFPEVRLGRLVLKVTLHRSNGMMAVEHKKRVIKKRAKQAALGAEVRPVELKEQDMAASKNETTENVKNVSCPAIACRSPFRCLILQQTGVQAALSIRGR